MPWLWHPPKQIVGSSAVCRVLLASGDDGGDHDQGVEWIGRSEERRICPDRIGLGLGRPLTFTLKLAARR